MTYFIFMFSLYIYLLSYSLNPLYLSLSSIIFCSYLLVYLYIYSNLLFSLF